MFVLPVKSVPETEGPQPLRCNSMACIGNTPCMEFRSLSEASGCTILAKIESMNVTSSVKDRAVKSILQDAIESGRLKPGDTIVEATGGNTGLALAVMAANRFKIIVTCPESIGAEKLAVLAGLGVEIIKCPIVSINDPNHFYRRAIALGQEEGKVFLNQFDNLANMQAHLLTGREIFNQTDGKIDGFISGMGTGGTLSGCATYLTSKKPEISIGLVDPNGSCLANYFINGVLQPNPGPGSISEGTGHGRITGNMAEYIKNAPNPEKPFSHVFHCTNDEIVAMGHYILKHEGILIGASSCMNLVGAVKMARTMKKGSTIVTVCADSGERYMSTIYSCNWLQSRELKPGCYDKSDLSFVL